MGRRALHFRIAFATAGAASLLAGAAVGVHWLALAGVLVGGVADVYGILQARKRFPEPALRAIRGASEGLPALGVAAYEPGAIGICVVVIVYGVMAAGMATVCESRQLMLGHIGGETTRRVFTSLCSLAALAIVAIEAAGGSVHALLGREPAALMLVLVGVMVLVQVRGLLDIALEIRRAGRRNAFQNVDT